MTTLRLLGIVLLIGLGLSSASDGEADVQMPIVAVLSTTAPAVDLPQALAADLSEPAVNDPCAELQRTEDHCLTQCGGQASLMCEVAACAELCSDRGRIAFEACPLR